MHCLNSTQDYNTFRMGIEQKLESTRFEFSDSVGDCYDAMWALAQALNRTASGQFKTQCTSHFSLVSSAILHIRSDLNTNNTLSWLAALAEPINATDRGFNLGDFSYKNNIVQRIMFKHLEKTNFTGITVSTCNTLISSNVLLSVFIPTCRALSHLIVWEFEE